MILPYKEKDVIDEHFFSFYPNNIPLFFPDRFRLVWSRVIDCKDLDYVNWTGEQILLVFSDLKWCHTLGLTLKDCSIMDSDIPLQVDKLQLIVSKGDKRIEKLSEEVFEKDKRIEKLSGEVFEKDKQIADIYKSHSWQLVLFLRNFKRLWLVLFFGVVKFVGFPKKLINHMRIFRLNQCGIV